MDNNGLMTGVIPGNSGGLHKTYEESFLKFFKYSEVDSYFKEPKKMGIFFDPCNNNVFCLELSDLENMSSKLIRLEIINLITISSGVILELIDETSLHNHLLNEAYERQLLLNNNTMKL